MTLKFAEIEGNVMTLHLSGTLRKEDMLDLQRKSRVLIEQGRKLRVLARIEGFTGWEKTAAWDDLGEDMEFMMAHGDDIVKMAFVGDPAWKEQVFLFVGKGLRATEIEYFTPGQLKDASTWVRG
jgi:hypothetical protein